MSEEQQAHENEVFDQKLSMDDLDAAAGGYWQFFSDDMFGPRDADRANCI